MIRFVVGLLGISVVMSTAQAGEPTTSVEAAQPESIERAEDDPLTQALRSEVNRYYREIGTEPTEAEQGSGLEAVRFMLLDGVTIEQIVAAIDLAIQLNDPQRRVVFEVAVPMRIDAGTTVQPAPVPEASPVPEERGVLEDQADAASAAERVATSESNRRLRRQHRIKGSLALGFGIGLIPLGSVSVGTGIGLLAFMDALGDVTASDPFSLLFLGLFGAILGPTAYLVAIPAIVAGTAFIATGGILIGLGSHHLQRSRTARALQGAPGHRYSLARRAQVQWGFRFVPLL